MRVLFCLAGLHRVPRGAEVAFEAVARQLATTGDEVTLMGGGRPRPDDPYRFVHVPYLDRRRFERWPNLPALRTAAGYEGVSALGGELLRYRPDDYDVTVTCGYPFENWLLRRPARSGRPAHVWVTQNGDWPASTDVAEYRWFGCDTLLCTNPIYAERNAARWRCALVPNGVDTSRFAPGPGERARFRLPTGRPVVLMVSALDPNKRVLEAIRAVAAVDDTELVVAGDGPLREQVDRLAGELLPGRFRRTTVAATEMPALYRSADVVLHTALDESFGNVYVEALATGVPIVAHRTTTTEWILGEHARLVDTTDPALLIEAVRSALADTGADRRAARVAAAADRFAWSVVGAGYRAALEAAVASRS
jgi:glycosyltransferase involved in cell wall biosynthesis